MFWLADVRLARVEGYNRRQLAQVEKIIGAHVDDWLRKWHDYFD